MSAPLRMLLGLLKGAVIGAGVGIGFAFLPLGPGAATWISMLLTGALVGIVCGVPFWKKDQWITTIIKAVFGLGIGALANFLLDRFAYFIKLPFLIKPDVAALPIGDHWIGVAAFGALWGLLIDLDNTPEANKEAKESNKKK